MNTIDIINAYDKIINQLNDDIKNSNYKIQYFLDLLDIKRSFFYKKLKEKRFTTNEVKLLHKHLYPEQYKDYEIEVIEKIILQSQNDFKTGKSENFETLLAESKAKYGL